MKGMVIYSNYAELAEELLEAGKITYGKYEELMLEGGYGEILFGDGEENANLGLEGNRIRRKNVPAEKPERGQTFINIPMVGGN